ncbi:MAG: ArsR/SmtB family transcription factor [Vibrionaceae bacterium]
MEQSNVTSILESLCAGVRLDAFRLLVKAEPQGLVAGEISTALELPPAHLSFHLKVLAQSRLVTVTQEGRFLRYRANLALIQEVIAYLTEECCAGVPALAAQDEQPQQACKLENCNE